MIPLDEYYTLIRRRAINKIITTLEADEEPARAVVTDHTLKLKQYGWLKQGQQKISLVDKRY